MVRRVRVLLLAVGSLSGHVVARGLSTELDLAAVESVMPWPYAAPTLNGQPAALPLTVTVNFAMQEAAE
jgi:hypothetical protein